MIQLISEHPNVGHPTDDFKDAIEYPIRKTPFTMCIKGNELQVLRVLDQRGGFFKERTKLQRSARRIRKNLRSVFELDQVSVRRIRAFLQCQRRKAD